LLRPRAHAGRRCRSVSAKLRCRGRRCRGHRARRSHGQPSTATLSNVRHCRRSAAEGHRAGAMDGPAAAQPSKAAALEPWTALPPPSRRSRVRREHALHRTRPPEPCRQDAAYAEAAAPIRIGNPPLVEHHRAPRAPALLRSPPPLSPSVSLCSTSTERRRSRALRRRRLLHHLRSVSPSLSISLSLSLVDRMNGISCGRLGTTRPRHSNQWGHAMASRGPRVAAPLNPLLFLVHTVHIRPCLVSRC
jgi:hypothetical protein